MNETLKLLHKLEFPSEAIALLEKVAANLPGMIFQFRQQPNGSQMVLYISSGCRELSELEPKVIQANWQILYRLIYPRDRTKFIKSLAVAFATLEPWRWEGRIITPSGKLKWIEGACQLEPQVNGDILCNGLVIDITHRKQTEEKLRASEARYQAILAAIPDLMFRISRDGEYLDLKGDGINLTLNKDEIVGKNMRDLLPSDIALIGQETITKTLDAGTLQTCEYQLPSTIGIRDYEARLVVSGADEVLAIVRDITERKQAEAQMRLAAQRDRLLTETLVRIRSSLNLEQILQTTVSEVRQFLQADRVFIGLNHAQVKAKAIAESVDPKYPSVLGWTTGNQTYLQELKTMFSTDRVRIVEDVNKIIVSPKLQAHYQQFQTRATLGVPIMLGTELFGALIANQCSGSRHWQPIEIDLLQQLSEQLAIAIQQAQLYQELAQLNTNLERQVEERTAQLQQKMQELANLQQVKDVMLHTVAHDLRTTVMGNLMVLKNLLQNQETEESISTPGSGSSALIPVSGSVIERMIQGNDRQLAMINSLLEIHCFMEQGVVLHSQPVNINTLLAKITPDLQPLLHQNQATLENLVREDLPLVMADPTQLQRVLLNLVTYSLQHNPPGLNFSLTATVIGKTIRMQIQHNGLALSKLDGDRLFDLYVRDPQAPCSTILGLKMYLCRQIIQAHGGQIGVISNGKQGLTFWFTLASVDYLSDNLPVGEGIIFQKVTKSHDNNDKW